MKPSRIHTFSLLDTVVPPSAVCRTHMVVILSGHPLFVHPKRHPNIAMRICQNKSRARLLLPLLRSDDLGIEAGEVLIDLVLGAVGGFL